MLNIGWFSTGRDQAARQLLQTVQDGIRSGDIGAKIGFVFSSGEPDETNENDVFFELGTKSPNQASLNHPPSSGHVRGDHLTQSLIHPGATRMP